jgi:predicted nucleic acid-binding protein
MAAPLYLDTSAVLRAVLEAGTTPEVESRLRDAPVLITSRLSLVESAGALHRARGLDALPEPRLADAEREVDAIWARCDVWELTRGVCDLARTVAPAKIIRTLDALHLATFVLARRRVEGLELLSTDDRLLAAAGVV